MGRFRRTGEVDARQYDGTPENAADLIVWLKSKNCPAEETMGRVWFGVPLSDGRDYLTEGDWLVYEREQFDRYSQTAFKCQFVRVSDLEP